MYFLCISLQIYSYVSWNDMAHTCTEIYFFFPPSLLLLSDSFIFCSVRFVTFLLIFRGNVYKFFLSSIFFDFYGSIWYMLNEKSENRKNAEGDGGGWRQKKVLRNAKTKKFNSKKVGKYKEFCHSWNAFFMNFSCLFLPCRRQK